MLATEIFDFTSGGGGALEFKHSKASKQQVKAAAVPTDEEKPKHPSTNSSGSSDTLGAQEEEELREISGRRTKALEQG